MKEAEKTNFLKIGGVSLPQLLITLLWIVTSYLVYPHQAPKTDAQSISSNKPKAKLAKASGSPTKKNNANTHNDTNTVFTPIITAIISPTPAPELVSDIDIVSIAPTDQPSPTPVSTNQTIPTTSTPKDAPDKDNKPAHLSDSHKKNTNDDNQNNSPVIPLLQKPTPHQKPALPLPLLSEN